jgi:hypothetical protein
VDGRYVKNKGLETSAQELGLRLPALPNPEYQTWKSGGFIYAIDNKRLGTAFASFRQFLTADVHGTTVDSSPELTWDVHFHEFKIETREDVSLFHAL